MEVYELNNKKLTMLKMKENTYLVNFHEEICCEICCEVVHFHIDKCPVCNTNHAGTNQFCSVQECIDEEDGI